MNRKNNQLKLILTFILLFIGLQSNLAWGKNMQEEVIHFAHTQYKKIIHDKTLTPQQRLYQFSMPLLALATVKENTGYSTILSNMASILNDDAQRTQIQKPWELWMLGRMAIAAKLAGDKERLPEIKNALYAQLRQHDAKDVITGWAFAYFAAIDVDSYQQSRLKLMEYTDLARSNYMQNPKAEASNFIWTLVMNLYASANAGNTEDYQYFIHELKTATEKNSLKETTLLVPVDDYRQWLVSVARVSFKRMNDEVSLKELESIHAPTISDSDSMLAWANEILVQKSGKV